MTIETLMKVAYDVTYKPHWFFDVVERDRGSELIITTHTMNSLHPEEEIQVRHVFAVPPVAYDEEAWARWLLDKIICVEIHEACEFFQIHDKRPYFPDHSPTKNPYVVTRV